MTPIRERVGVLRFRASASEAGVAGMEYEIGIGKTGRRSYGLDEVAIVPSQTDA